MEQIEVKLPLFPKRVWLCSGIAFLILATAFVGARTYRNFAVPGGQFDWDKRGMSDFYTLYYYSSAFSNGVNPYSTDVMKEYEVPRNAAPFSPFAFLIDLPLTWLPLNVACAVFFIFSWCLLGVLSWCCLSMARIKFDWALWSWIFGFLVFSRPGHITLFTGYFTIQIVIGLLVALHFSKSRPWLSGLGFLFAAVKPTYAIPLTILMFARRDFKAAMIGVVLTSTFALACFGWLAMHSDMSSVVEGIRDGQQAFHDDETELPINTWTRIDVAGMAAKVMIRAPGNGEYLATMMVLLIVPCMAIWKASNEQRRNASDLSALIVILTLLVSIYHHSYDCLLVAAAISALGFNSTTIVPQLSRFKALAIATLLLIPMLNYLSTMAARDRLGFDQLDIRWQAITMLNGICLTIALLVCIHAAFSRDGDT